MPLPELPRCPDCDAGIGELHHDRCDVARCATIGSQRLLRCASVTGCNSDPRIDCRTAWSGLWPGAAECREYGWYASGPPWTPCSADTPGAIEDLNRLLVECEWDPSAQRFVRPEHSKQSEPPAPRPLRRRRPRSS